ncbi:hypothetical protein LZ554_009330 [Drepanopeziza brunnea f. sp. 'monogermtubi']|nr:hypothetical protein LZ554_009330 [Drepanopeziza brunnea f. sp. 'monogermtubi']
MRYSAAIAVAIFATFAVGKTCINQTIPVHISARQAVFDIAIPQTNSEVTDFILNVTQQGRNWTELILKGYDTTVGTYNISTQFCMPDCSNITNPTVQVLTHGVGFDKTYWDLSFNNYSYSYLNVAADDYKYFTLSFDRLGIANSSHGEPLNEIQAYLEVEATAALTRMLRDGSFPGVNQKFSKVVHVGHSFGAAQTYTLANLYPELTDGIVLTGFTTDSSYIGLFVAGGNFQLANKNQPLRFGDITGAQADMFVSMYAEALLGYITPVDLTSVPEPQRLPNGYLVSSNAEANKYLFLKPHYYDPAILALAERTKQPVTLGELLTIGSLVPKNSYTGPVLAISGDSDLPFCGSDCLATDGQAASIPAQVEMNFPMADFASYIQPNTGHGLNFHYNATAGYQVIQEFLASKGLASS